VGLDVTDRYITIVSWCCGAEAQLFHRGIYSCTSGGALKITTVVNQGEASPTQLASLPSRLRDWHLSSDEETFCYGGDEVDLSVWNTTRAFAPPPEDRSATSSKKRKRGGDLFPGEIWRAKNVNAPPPLFPNFWQLTESFGHGQVPNDYLGLRQPVRITSLTYLSPSTSTSHHHILTGTQLGDVRRYDTRAARRPTADWKGIGKIGGVKVVEKGLEEQSVCPSFQGQLSHTGL
jgi:ribosome biogenesis protein NSA1